MSTGGGGAAATSHPVCAQQQPCVQQDKERMEGGTKGAWNGVRGVDLRKD